MKVVRVEGDAELGLVGGVLTGHELIIGVGVDLRQQLIDNISAVSEIRLS